MLRIHAQRSYVAARKVVQAEQLLLKEELRFSSNLQLEGVLFRRLHGLRREGPLGEALVRGAGAGRKGGGRTTVGLGARTPRIRSSLCV